MCLFEGITEAQAQETRQKLRAGGLDTAWAPAGQSEPPPPIVEVPPNEAPVPILEIPEDPALPNRSLSLLSIGLVAGGFAILLGARLTLGDVSQGRVGIAGAMAFGVGLAVLGIGVTRLVAEGLFRTLPHVASFVPSVLVALAVPVSCAAISAPSEADTHANIQHYEAEILGGQVPEARAFLAAGGALATAEEQGPQLIEALYDAGARRLFAIDEDQDQEAEWLAIDMPVLPARRGAITSLMHRYTGSALEDIPASLRQPSSRRFWIVPVDLH